MVSVFSPLSRSATRKNPLSWLRMRSENLDMVVSPLWVGGESPGALRRAVKLGNAWYPGNNSQLRPLDTIARLEIAFTELQRACERSGRDPASLGRCVLIQDFFDWTPRKTEDGRARRLFTGSSADMTQDAASLSGLGITHAALRLGGDSLDEALERIERFGAEVIANTAA